MSRALPTIPTRNNIGALRLIFALTVLFVHSAALSAEPSLAWLGVHLDSELAVRGFFILSGFLVVMSYEKSRSLGDYASKRICRIYPAYALVIVVAALAGSLLSTLPLQEYFSGDVLRYLGNNLAFLNFRHPELPGLFQQNPTHAVNGALWTIKLEVMFYACVPLLVWLLRGRYRLAWIVVIYSASYIYAWYFAHLAIVTGHANDAELGRQLPGQMSYFITGAALYYYDHWLRANFGMAVLAAVMALFAGIPFLAPVAIGVIVFTAAWGRYWGNAERYGDISYGLYIWHYPILQTLVTVGVFAFSPYLALLCALALTAAAALVSWHLIEKRFLRKSSHYVQAERPVLHLIH